MQDDGSASGGYPPPLLQGEVAHISQPCAHLHHTTPALAPLQAEAAAALEAKAAELQAAATQHAEAIQAKQAELTELGQTKVGGRMVDAGHVQPRCTEDRPARHSAPLGGRVGMAAAIATAHYPPSAAPLDPSPCPLFRRASHRPACRRSCRPSWPTRLLCTRRWRRGLPSWRRTPAPRRWVLPSALGRGQARGWAKGAAGLLMLARAAALELHGQRWDP